MTVRRKNKTFATFLAAVLGSLGAHRFYLHGMKDFTGWVHFACTALALLLLVSRPEQPFIFTGLPFFLSALVGVLAALVIGLTSDEKWDARHNPGCDRPSSSGWVLVILLVLSFSLGALGVLSLIARATDMMLTGGTYG